MGAFAGRGYGIAALYGDGREPKSTENSLSSERSFSNISRKYLLNVHKRQLR